MEIKFNQEDIKSIDQDYPGQQFFHKNEKVKVINPDNKYYSQKGKFIKVEKNKYNNDYIVKLN